MTGCYACIYMSDYILALITLIVPLLLLAAVLGEFF